MTTAKTAASESNQRYFKAPVFAVAPMIDWTDRHCRTFHRQLSRHALLYTEMVVADAISHAVRDPRKCLRRARALGSRLAAEFAPALQAERLLATWRRLADPAGSAAPTGEAPESAVL